MTTEETNVDSATVPLARRHAGAKRRLAVYLQDHDAGAEAGVALIQRCREANRGSEFESDLDDLVDEIQEDHHSLRSVMQQLGIGRSRLKELLGRAAELVARLKSNGRFVRYSASSRVVELEAMAAGVATKRNLWRALGAASTAIPRRDLDRLTDRATDQLERLLALHERAAALAFADDD